MMDILDNPTIIALIAGLPAMMAGWWGYRQAVRKDAGAFHIAAMTQVIDGLQELVASLQSELRARDAQIAALLVERS